MSCDVVVAQVKARLKDVSAMVSSMALQVRALHRLCQCSPRHM
jgi:hypothetical protein